MAFPGRDRDTGAHFLHDTDLELEPRVSTGGWRLPPDKGDLPRPHVDGQVRGRVRSRGDGGRPRQPVVDGGVGVVQLKVVLGPGQPAGELDDVRDGLRPEGGVGLGHAHLRLVVQPVEAVLLAQVAGDANDQVRAARHPHAHAGERPRQSQQRQPEVQAPDAFHRHGADGADQERVTERQDKSVGKCEEGSL